MSEISNVLITCCLGDHIKSNVVDIKKVYPNCKVVGIDMKEMSFNHNAVDCFYQVPKCTDEKYIDSVIDVCKKEDIDIVVSFSSLDIVPFIKNRTRFDEIGVVVALGNNIGTVLANEKNTFFECCKKIGAKIPKTSDFIYDSVSLKKWMIDNNVNSVVTKVADSTGAKGMGMYSISDLDSHDDFEFYEPVIAQEFLSGAEYSVDCFCEHGKVLFGCTKINYAMDLGVSIYSEVVDRKDIVDLCIPICNEFELDGLVGFDLKEDNNGNVYVIECNPRPTATISLIAKAGVNLRAHLLEYYSSGHTAFDEKLNCGMKIARFREDYYFEGDFMNE